MTNNQAALIAAASLWSGNTGVFNLTHITKDAEVFAQWLDSKDTPEGDLKSILLKVNQELEAIKEQLSKCDSDNKSLLAAVDSMHIDLLHSS